MFRPSGDLGAQEARDLRLEGWEETTNGVRPIKKQAARVEASGGRGGGEDGLELSKDRVAR